MTLAKALEILTELIVGADSSYLPDTTDALKLGREALRRVHSIRRDRYVKGGTPLIGEDTT